MHDGVKSICLGALMVALATLWHLGPLLAQDARDLRPTEHLKIENPDQIDGPEAQAIYQRISAELADFYAISREPAAIAYRQWKRYNTAPYLSATHGNRYVNNYANARAKDYADLKPGLKLPRGAVVAKDSFTVTADGEVFGGALFLMQKLARGASPKTADWRYVMILPDGSYLGDSHGDNAADVAYCHTCHRIRARTDYLFYIPKRYRP